MKKTKGISLIVLVITIIVIIILAGTVILSLSTNNPITQAKQATFKAGADAYNSELAMTLSSKYVAKPTFNPKTLYAGVWDGNPINTSGTIKEYIPSITSVDAAKYIIQQGKLVYVGIDTNEKLFAKDLGFEDPYVKNGLALWIQGADFTNSPQSTSVINRSGSGNNAIPHNFAYTTSSGSDDNNNIVFDGIDDNLTLNNIVLPPNNFTVGAWIYINAHSTNTNVGQIITQQYTSYYGWIFSLNGTNSYLQLRNHNGTTTSTAYNLSSSTGLNLNTWYYVVGSDDGTTVKLYLNGTQIASCPSAPATVSMGDTNIGYFSTSYYYFNGKMKDVQIYNRALTTAEVLQNYNAGK
jgi:Tfp pilus assembly protein PilE